MRSSGKISPDETLLMANIFFCLLSEELFYQVVLQEFSNFGCIRLSEALSIRDCVKLALEAEQSRDALPDHLKPHDTVADIIANTLQARADMMQEYFSMEIKEGAIHTLPMLLKDYVPAMDKIPLFLLRLGTEVRDPA